MMNGYGMGGGAWIWMLVVWIVLIGVIAFAIVRLVGRGDRSTDAGATTGGPPSPREVLDRRLASGEIDLETYGVIADRLAHRTER